MKEPPAVTVEDEESNEPDPVRKIVSPVNGPTVAMAELGPMRLNEYEVLVACTAKIGSEIPSARMEMRTRTDILDSAFCKLFFCTLLVCLMRDITSP